MPTSWIGAVLGIQKFYYRRVLLHEKIFSSRNCSYIQIYESVCSNVHLHFFIAFFIHLVSSLRHNTAIFSIVGNIIEFACFSKPFNPRLCWLMIHLNGWKLWMYVGTFQNDQWKYPDKEVIMLLNFRKIISVKYKFYCTNKSEEIWMETFKSCKLPPLSTQSQHWKT